MHSTEIIWDINKINQKPNYKSKNGGLLLDQHFIYPFFYYNFVNAS